MTDSTVSTREAAFGDGNRRSRSSKAVRTINLIAVVLPFLGVIAAMVLAWGYGFSWLMLGLFLGMYLLTGFGITIGYHRLFTHRAFDTSPAVKATLGILGSMAAEGPVLWWVASHRRHHQHADEEGDPHSPHLHGEGFRGLLRGLWHAHIGWLFQLDAPGLARYVGDLRKDRVVSWVNRLFPLWVLAGLLIPAALGGLITMSWSGALLGFVWGGLVRVFVVHHTTWSINSVCHLWGYRTFDGHDESRNNPVFGILAMGEGWHNNHHAFPTSARHGLRWWEIDTSYWIIRLLGLMGLAWNIKVPSAEAIDAKRQRAAGGASAE